MASAHTNGVESIWAVLKRGYNGTDHNWSMKHCLNEFSFRLNEGKVNEHSIDRMCFCEKNR